MNPPRSIERSFLPATSFPCVSRTGSRPSRTSWARSCATPAASPIDRQRNAAIFDISSSLLLQVAQRGIELREHVVVRAVLPVARVTPVGRKRSRGLLGAVTEIEIRPTVLEGLAVLHGHLERDALTLEVSL